MTGVLLSSASCCCWVGVGVSVPQEEVPNVAMAMSTSSIAVPSGATADAPKYTIWPSTDISSSTAPVPSEGANAAPEVAALQSTIEDLQRQLQVGSNAALGLHSGWCAAQRLCGWVVAGWSTGPILQDPRAPLASSPPPSPEIRPGCSPGGWVDAASTCDGGEAAAA